MSSETTGGDVRPDPTKYDEGFFEVVALADTSAREVWDVVLPLVQPSSVVDLGCGVGLWLRVLQEITDCEIVGVDGAYVPLDQRQIEPSHFVEHDLTQRVTLDRDFDLAMSLEVAEHLPESRARSFVEDLTNLAPVVLFSAAIPGQGGVNHVNEQWQSYWVKLFASVGYEVADVIRPTIWNRRDIEFYYRQNLLLFVDPTRVTLPAVAGPSPIDLVHPGQLNLMAHWLHNPEPLTVKVLLKRLPAAVTQSIRHRLRRA